MYLSSNKSNLGVPVLIILDANCGNFFEIIFLCSLPQVNKFSIFIKVSFETLRSRYISSSKVIGPPSSITNILKFLDFNFFIKF